MTKLAIDGGERMVPEGAVKPWPPIDQRDRDAVLRVFDNQIVCGGDAPETVALQNEWAEGRWPKVLPGHQQRYGGAAYVAGCGRHRPRR